jgi:hypothetical protein
MFAVAGVIPWGRGLGGFERHGLLVRSRIVVFEACFEGVAPTSTGVDA